MKIVHINIFSEDNSDENSNTINENGNNEVMVTTMVIVYINVLVKVIMMIKVIVMVRIVIVMVRIVYINMLVRLVSITPGHVKLD
jgi:hypothetical protein